MLTVRLHCGHRHLAEPRGACKENVRCVKRITQQIARSEHCLGYYCIAEPHKRAAGAVATPCTHGDLGGVAAAAGAATGPVTANVGAIHSAHGLSGHAWCRDPLVPQHRSVNDGRMIADMVYQHPATAPGVVTKMTPQSAGWATKPWTAGQKYCPPIVPSAMPLGAVGSLMWRFQQEQQAYGNFGKFYDSVDMQRAGTTVETIIFVGSQGRFATGLDLLAAAMRNDGMQIPPLTLMH